MDWSKFNPAPIFLALVGRILDLFTVKVALALNPLAWELNLFGVNFWLGTFAILWCCLSFQIFNARYGSRYPIVNRLMVLGSWILVVVTFIPVFNNLGQF